MKKVYIIFYIKIKYWDFCTSNIKDNGSNMEVGKIPKKLVAKIVTIILVIKKDFDKQYRHLNIKGSNMEVGKIPKKIKNLWRVVET